MIHYFSMTGVAYPAFKVGGKIEPPYFVDRGRELAALRHDACTLAQSNVIIAPRRFGKTALLRAVEAALLSEEMLAVYIPCLGMLNPVGFHDRVIEGVLSAFSHHHGKGKMLLATWRDLLKKPILGMRDRLEEIGGSIEGVGTIRLKFRTQEVDEHGLLEAALDFPERFGVERGERVILILDEFQALAPFGDLLFPLLKEKMEGQTHVGYLFSGSSMRLLRDLFGREGVSPLYQMVGRLFLGEIAPKEVRRFYRSRLRDVHGVEITDAALARVIERVGGIPYYFQKLGVELERRIITTGREKLTPQDVEEGFTRLIEELSADFQERWETRFSDQQRAIMKELAESPKSVTEIAHSLGASPQNLSYNLSRLTEAMILTKEEKRYRITDRVFTTWLHEL
ncbi:hypothetical protein DRJ12_03425 [Candidatus Acetothermia bacterium]|nr:MAG: hypothetical protein DRJ12_03425 [Candidatus Acetothermia bacterium]